MDPSRQTGLRPLTGNDVKQQARIKSRCPKDRLLGSSRLSSQREEHKNHLTATMASQRQSTRAWASSSLAKLKRGLARGFNLILVVALVVAAIEAQRSDAAATTTMLTTGGGQHETKAALEAELNSLLQQHGDGQDAKALSEAIISRWMLGNLSDSAMEKMTSDLDGSPPPMDTQQSGGELDQSADTSSEQELSGPEAVRLRKVISFLRNFELTGTNSGLNNGQVLNQFPVLPASQAATIKRASIKMGNYLRQQQQQQHGPPRQISAYGRNPFDFGLGKRPDASVAGNILRFGDSAIPVSSGFGKRPSAHRYDFGLGKRVASPAYPRYDFGLGKRAPNRIRYDFGLGKR